MFLIGAYAVRQGEHRRAELSLGDTHFDEINF